MVTKLVTTRPAPWLHAAAIGAFVSLTVVVCKETPRFAWAMAPLGFAWSRIVGWALLRLLFRRERSPVVGGVELEQARATLYGTVHNLVNALSVLQGQVDQMIMRAGRLQLALDRMGPEEKEHDG